MSLSFSPTQGVLHSFVVVNRTIGEALARPFSPEPAAHENICGV